MSCQNRTATSSGDRLLQIEKSSTQDLSGEVSTPEALCDYLSDKGYYKGNNYTAGTEVAFSASYGIDAQSSNSAEAGQAYGEITADGFFNQKNMTTTQLLVCPGARSSAFSGKCNWKLSGDDGYAALAYRVVCNKAATFTRSRLHPGYETMKVTRVQFKASTAGKSFRYNDAIEVELASGSTSVAQIYFAHGAGLVATEFRESSDAGGTAKVYIGATPSN